MRILKKITAIVLIAVFMFSYVPNFGEMAWADNPEPGIVSSINLEVSGEFILPTLNTIHYSVIDEDSDKYEITDISGWCSDSKCTSTEGLTEVSYCYKRVNIETKGDYKFNDTVTTNFDDDTNVTFTRDDDTHAHFIVKKSTTAFNGIYIDYEKPNNADEMHALKKGDVTVKGVSENFNTDKEPLYGLSRNPDHIGTDLLIILVSFDSAEDASNIDKKFYFRGEDISDKFYTSEALAIANVDKLDYAVCLSNDGKKYMFIEKFDFSRSANFNVTLNAGMKVSDVTGSVSHNVEQTESEPTEVYITNSGSKDVLPLGDDEVIEAGKTYYLAIRVPKTKYYYDYNVVRLNGKKLALTTNPLTENAAYYSFLSETESLVVMYEFVPNTPSSGSKRYKTEDNDTTKDVTGIAKKGSKRIIKPIEGRKIKEVIVKDEKGNPIDVTMNEDGTYTFIQPASNVSIKVTYEPREMTLEEGTTKVTLDGEAISSDASVISSGDKKLVPIRVVTESLGGTVAWKEEEPDLIQIDKGGKAIDISLSSNVIKVDGVDVSMSTKPVVISNRTYLPVDFYEDVFNLVVQEYENQLNSYMKIYENY